MLCSARRRWRAVLVFLVQPLIGKLLLPSLGGSPAVWTTCMLFFQSALILGYGWAHGLARVRSLRRQVTCHATLLVVALLFLPLALPASAMDTLASGADPKLWVLATVGLMVGMPFVALSAQAPLLQSWFSRTVHPRAQNPYFLYALSNVGSVGTLLAFPFVLERAFDISALTRAWSIGVFVGAALVTAAGVVAVRQERRAPADAGNGLAFAWPKPRTGLQWLLLAAVPSSHMLGVTQYLGTDLASLPLLWILPLSLYLGTFIIAFSRWGSAATKLATRALPFGLIALFFLLVVQATEPLGVIASVHGAVFFLAAMALHGRLAEARPAASGLTAYYFMLSLGGALGGVMNAVLAPLLFDDLTEYPLALCAAAGLVGASVVEGGRGRRLLGLVVPLALGGVAAATGIALHAAGLAGPLARLCSGLPLVFAFLLVRRPPRFAVALLAIYVGASATPLPDVHVLLQERSFFGVLRVVEAKDGSYREIRHGTTVHGRQWASPRAQVPGAYYHPAGPAGDVFRALTEAHREEADVAVIGLGAGALAAYARPGQRWRFYELDPGIAAAATDPRTFTFLSESKARDLDVLVGDGRLLLQSAADGAYDLLVLDAFSSGAIPLHLLTREALAAYTRVTTPHGLIAMHISNRYLDLESTVGALADDAGLLALGRDDFADDPWGDEREPSRWVLLARPEHPPRLPPSWRRLQVGPRVPTDAFSDAISLFGKLD